MTNSDSQLRSIVNSASRKIANWAEKEFASPFYLDNNVIYHYTNSAGLKGIIETNSLWATNSSFVNDSKELKLGLLVYKQICKKLSRKQNNENFKNVLKAFLKRLTHKNISNRYVCSFSNNGDQLSQWIGYGSNGLGYAIGFETKKLIGNLKPPAEPSIIIYDVEAQKKYVERHLEELLNGLLKAVGDNSLEKHLDAILDILEKGLDFLLHKNGYKNVLVKQSEIPYQL